MNSLLLLLSLVTCAWAKTEFTEDEGVIVLNKDNFNGVISEIDYVLVEFYAPWCGHCKALKPEYEKAASILKTEFPNGDVRVAKVDATVETELASEHVVSGYPTLKLHKQGKWYDYNSDRQATAIVEWLKRKTQPALRIISTAEDLDSFKKSADVVVVGFIKEGHASSQVLESVAEDMEKIVFALVTSSDLMAKQGIQKDSSVVVYKKFDEASTEYEGEMTSDALNEFITKESIPLVVEFSQESAGSVFGSPVKVHVVAFAKKGETYDQNKETLTTVAKKFKGKAHFIIIDTGVEDHKRILEFFGMSGEDVPSYRMINLTSDMTKFKPDVPEITESTLTAFVKEVLEGQRKPFLISQDIPAASDEPVRVLVGKNFNEVTQDESKAVFAELYAPWCGHCQQLAPIWTELGENYKGREDIIIAKMDATANEAEGLRVHSFPTLKYYPKGSGEAIDYSGERTLEALKAFVDSEGKTGASEKTEDEEPKDEL